MSKVIATSYARSGTRSLAHFLLKLGVNASWQHGLLPPGDSTGFYNLNNIPEKIKIFAHNNRDVMNKMPFDFESHWAFSFFMYPIQQYDPTVKWIFITRDPIDCCNSMLNFWNKCKDRDYTLEDCARKYDEVYTFAIRQILIMNPKPVWMSFEKFISGDCTEKLFELFDISKTPKNFSIAKKQLTIKINSFGEYENILECPKYKIHHCLLSKCQYMKEILERVCDEL